MQFQDTSRLEDCNVLCSPKTALDVHGKLHIRLQQAPDNKSWVGVIEDPRRMREDDIGALYYVVAVIFIYGLSIVMMIASHIRKNNQDTQLRAYLKDMANLRKTDRREKVLSKMTDIAKRQEERQAMEAEQKLKQAREKELASDPQDPSSRPLLKKENNEDNTDSVFLPPDFCIGPVKKFESSTAREKLSESSSCREPTSVSSKESARNNSTSSTVCSNVPSVTSPSLSEPRLVVQPRLNSPGPQRWKPNSNHRSTSSSGEQRLRLSPNFSEPGITKSPSSSRSPSLNEFRISPLCGDRSPTNQESRTIPRLGKSKSHGGLQPSTDFKRQRVLHTVVHQSAKSPAASSPEVKTSFPASFQLVDEDEVL